MMTATDAAAWWGAVIATLVFAWDFYKWMNRGASVVVTVYPNMESFGAMPSALDGKTYVVVEVKNLGDGSCTITHLIGVHYSSWFNKLRRKQTKSIYVGNPGVTKIPHVLPLGEIWTGIIAQTPDLETMSRNGYLYCGICHSTSKKPILKRVVAPNE